MMSEFSIVNACNAITVTPQQATRESSALSAATDRFPLKDFTEI